MSAMTGPGDLRDQRWLDDRIAAIEDGIEAVTDIARNWTDGRNLARLHSGVSAKDYILARVKHPLGPGVIIPLLAESNWTNVEIAAIAGVTEGAVRYHETRSNYEFDRTKRLLSDGSVREYEPRVVQAVVIDEPLFPLPPVTLTEAQEEVAKSVRAGATVVLSYRTDGDLIAVLEEEGLFVRIDRRSDWGNPFEMPGDGDRETVVSAYREHYLPFKPSLQERLGELRGKGLGCWCAPDLCHGDVLLESLV